MPLYRIAVKDIFQDKRDKYNEFLLSLERFQGSKGSMLFFPCQLQSSYLVLNSHFRTMIYLLQYCVTLELLRLVL